MCILTDKPLLLSSGETETFLPLHYRSPTHKFNHRRQSRQTHQDKAQDIVAPRGTQFLGASQERFIHYSARSCRSASKPTTQICFAERHRW